MSTITFTSPAAPGLDFVKYLWTEQQAVTKSDRYMSAATLDFALVPADASFVKLSRGAYIVVSSATYNNWFTGYVTNNPDLTYLGVGASGPVWGYVYHATSDEFLLTLNPVGIVPVFCNTYMGAIIVALANRLCPGIFDTSNVQQGPLVAQYIPDPTKSFYQVAQDLCNSASYMFWGNNHKLYFVPQNDPSVPATVVNGNDENFTPSNLSLSAVTTPIINDATVVGQIEPQRYVQEYFLGTGATSAFQLMDSVFGADSSLFINESFQGSSLNTGSGSGSVGWNVYDHSAEYLQVLDGYLNCLGGSNNGSFDVSLQSLTPLPMEGNIRFTHGEFDFLGGSGLVGSIWTGEYGSFATGVVSPTFGGCMYGIWVNAPANQTTYLAGSSTTTLNPLVAGGVDTTQSATVNVNSRYCIRTIAQFSRAHRSQQPYSYVDANGVVQTVSTVSPGLDTVTYQTYVTEINPLTGIVTNQWVWNNTAALTGTNDTYATYCPVVSNQLMATVTGITVWIPVNAALAVSYIAPFGNTGFDTWVDPTHMTVWSGESADGVFQSAVSASGSSLYLKQQTSTPYVAQYANGAIGVATSYNVQVLLQRDALCTTGSLKVVLDGTGLTETGITIPVSDITVGSFQSFSGVLTVPISTLPSDLALKVYLSGCTSTGYGVYVDDLQVSSAWALQLIGPNEIDAVDGFAPVATIVQPNSGSSTSSTYTGAPQYNAGQGQLVFFSDSVNLESNVPSSNELLLVTYRGAGAALGRVVNGPSVLAEAVAWGDNGVRSVVENSYNPLPRTSAECELAATAVVSENCFQHYQGTYMQRSNFPCSGYSGLFASGTTGTSFQLAAGFPTTTIVGAALIAAVSGGLTYGTVATYNISTGAGTVSSWSNGAPAVGAAYTIAIQPRGGSIIKFANLSSMAAVNAEQITAVTTSLDYDNPESFIHTITFGKPDLVQQFLNDMQNPVGSFQPNTDASTPGAIDTRAVGLSFAPDVMSATLLGWDGSYVYMDGGQPLVPVAGSTDRHTLGMYYEVRYTDKGWGPDSSQNLVTRTIPWTTNNNNGRLFQVPRSIRGQCFFVRQFSQWNFLYDSEDMTNANYVTSGGTSVANARANNPDNRQSQVSTVSFASSGTLRYSGNFMNFPTTWAQEACWSFSLNGPAATAVTATVKCSGTVVATLACTLNGSWQRFSVPLNTITQGASYDLILTCASSASVQVTRFSVECGTNAETLYVRTKNGVGGVGSRYSAAIHVAFPLPTVPAQALPTIVYVNANTTLVAPSVGDMVVEIDTTAGAVTVTLPPSSSFIGQNISCILTSYGTGNGGGYYNATVLAGSESIVGGGTVTDTYNGVSSWTLNTQWQGQNFLGTS